MRIFQMPVNWYGLQIEKAFIFVGILFAEICGILIIGIKKTPDKLKVLMNN